VLWIEDCRNDPLEAPAGRGLFIEGLASSLEGGVEELADVF